MTSECVGDTKGPRRLRKLKERSGVITEQIAELRSKQRLIWWEIVQLWAGALVDWVRKHIRSFTNAFTNGNE
jgi:hypothetical protein